MFIYYWKKKQITKAIKSNKLNKNLNNINAAKSTTISNDYLII